jgi:hypothetical protein
MGGKDGRNIDVSFLREGNRHPGKPFVEMRNDCLVLLMADELEILDQILKVAFPGSLNLPRPGTKQQDIQKRLLHWSRHHLREMGLMRCSTSRSSTRPDTRTPFSYQLARLAGPLQLASARIECRCLGPSSTEWLLPVPGPLARAPRLQPPPVTVRLDFSLHAHHQIKLTD